MAIGVEAWTVPANGNNTAKKKKRHVVFTD
jgi:hypothetical protein